MKSDPQVIVVVGPTASGKSDFAVQIAHDLSRVGRGSEIISADSRQVYKGLDIGTGKITEEEMKGVPHHMLSIYELGEELSVARFARDATPILEDILKRNKTPIICGGTGQYIDALIFDTNIPSVPPNKSLREELEKLPTEELVARLSARDRERLASIDHNNRPRLIRALEVVEALGKVPTLNSPKLKYKTKIYLMAPSRKLLRERITNRLEKRLKVRMIDEVKDVISRLNHLGRSSVVMKRFGLEYAAITKFLNKEITEEQMKQEIITKSCQYAKRQETWNKKYLPIAEIVEIK